MSESKKTVIVTGGSGGIGEGICRRLAKKWNVVIHYNSNADAAERIKDSINSDDGSAIAIQANLSDEQAVKKMFDASMDQFGAIDAVVANAGVSNFGNIEDSATEDFEKLIEVNIVGSYLVIREAATRVSDGGKVVFVSSQLAERPRATTGMYSACKAAIDALIVSMSHELGAKGIRINSVRPGATEPGMFADSSEERKDHFRSLSPFKRLGAPDDIAGVVEFLVSDDARWMTGQHLRVDGGASN